jgi:7-carboxy-7-deazaguanine synthase
MFGENPIRPPVKGAGDILDVQHIFPTVQGEGPFAGTPAVFVRLGGCNLACRFCDTEFEAFNAMPIADILARVQSLSVANDGYPISTQLVVVTGGEPLRQPIAPLCDLLLQAGFRVQVETNGTLYRELPQGVHVVCSPKNNNGTGYAPVREDLLRRANAVKFIVSAHDAAYNHIAEVGQSLYGTPVYLQPMDEYDPQKNAANIALASKLAAGNGAKLSLQVHKNIGVE